MPEVSDFSLSSKRGVSYVLGSLVCLGLLVWSGRALLSANTPLEYILFGLLTIFLVWLLLTWLSLQLHLDPERLRMQSLWGQKELLWNSVAKVQPTLAPAPPFSFLVGLSRFGAGLVLLMLFPFDNAEALLREIINSVWRANPNARLASSLTARYGFPPYSRKRKD